MEDYGFSHKVYEYVLQRSNYSAHLDDVLYYFHRPGQYISPSYETEQQHYVKSLNGPESCDQMWKTWCRKRRFKDKLKKKKNQTSKNTSCKISVDMSVDKKNGDHIITNDKIIL